MGNQAVQRLAWAGRLSAAGDPVEREAERMASAALRGDGAPGGGARVTGAGQALPPQQRAFFESRYGADLGHVRLHGDGAAAEAARRYNARAFTWGSDIYLGASHTDLGSHDGQELLAHELAHVMQQVALHVPPDLIMRAQEKGDLQAFLELLDGPRFNAIMSKAVGPIQWPVIREVLKGAGGHLAQVPEERKAAIVARFGDLASPWGDWDDKLVFAKGFGWGLVKGVFSPITDLFDLLKTAVDVQQQVLGWLLTQGVRALDGRLQADVADVMAEFGEVGTQVRAAIDHAISNPEQALSLASQIADQAGGQALGLARKAGSAGAELLLKAAEAPMPQLGEGIGQIVGELIAEVVLAMLSAGAANAARAGVRGVTTAVKLLGSSPMKALRMAGAGIEQVMELVRRFKRLGAGVYSEVAGALNRALEKLMELLTRLFNLPGDLFDKAVAKLDDVMPGPVAVTDAGVPVRVPNALEARASRPGGGGGTAPRTTRTTVAELRPAAPEAPKVEAPAAAKPAKPKAAKERAKAKAKAAKEKEKARAKKAREKEKAKVKAAKEKEKAKAAKEKEKAKAKKAREKEKSKARAAREKARIKAVKAKAAKARKGKNARPTHTDVYGGYAWVDTRKPIELTKRQKAAGPIEPWAYQNEIPAERITTGVDLPVGNQPLELSGPLDNLNEIPATKLDRGIELSDWDGPMEMELPHQSLELNQIPAAKLDRAIDLPDADGPMDLDLELNQIPAAKMDRALDLPDADGPMELTDRLDTGGPGYQPTDQYVRQAVDLPPDKGEAIYAMGAKEEMYYRAIDPDDPNRLGAADRRRWGLSRLAEDTGFDPQFDRFKRKADVGFDPKVHGTRVVRSGPRTYKHDAEGRLVEYRSTKLTPKVRDSVMYRKDPGKKKGHDYGHLGASQQGHLDNELLHHGGAPQPDHRNRAVKGKGHPPWWQWEMKIKEHATGMQNRAEDFEIVAELQWKGDVPVARRISLHKVTKDRQGNIISSEPALDAAGNVLDSGWLPDTP